MDINTATSSTMTSTEASVGTKTQRINKSDISFQEEMNKFNVDVDENSEAASNKIEKAEKTEISRNNNKPLGEKSKITTETVSEPVDIKMVSTTKPAKHNAGLQQNNNIQSETPVFVSTTQLAQQNAAQIVITDKQNKSQNAENKDTENNPIKEIVTKQITIEKQTENNIKDTKENILQNQVHNIISDKKDSVKNNEKINNIQNVVVNQNNKVNATKENVKNEIIQDKTIITKENDVIENIKKDNIVQNNITLKEEIHNKPTPHVTQNKIDKHEVKIENKNVKNTQNISQIITEIKNTKHEVEADVIEQILEIGESDNQKIADNLTPKVNKNQSQTINKNKVLNQSLKEKVELNKPDKNTIVNTPLPQKTEVITKEIKTTKRVTEKISDKSIKENIIEQTQQIISEVTTNANQNIQVAQSAATTPQAAPVIDTMQTLIEANKQLANITLLTDAKVVETKVTTKASKESIKVDYTTVKMTTEDAVFFADLVQDTEKTLQNVVADLQSEAEQKVQEASKNVKVSATLMNAISEAAKTNQPMRIDFDKDVSIIIKIDKDGAVNAKFIPGDKAVEEYLKQNISALRQRFDEQDLNYRDLSYSNRQKQNQEQNRRNNKERDHE